MTTTRDPQPQDATSASPVAGSVIRRSELACPGHSASMMAHAAASATDEIVFDLEDGCAVSQKVAARGTVIEALTTLDCGGMVRTFRPNDPRTRYFYRDVIEVVTGAGRFLDGIVLPKVDGPEDVVFADRLLSQVEEDAGLPIGGIGIEAFIESARAVLRAEQIATASPRMTGLIFGMVDFAGDIGAQELGAEQFLYYNYAKAKIIVAARAAGLTCVDSVTLAIRDQDACRRDADMAARMGFDGKWAVHPAQLEPINAAFTPTRAQAEHAERVLQEYERASSQNGVGAIVVDDEMVDAASLRVERKRLAIARRAGVI